MDPMNNYLGINRNEYNTPIYRFTLVDYLLRLLNKHENTLVSPRKWKDPFEDILSKFKFKQSNGEFYKHPFRDRVYGQCWTEHGETDAAWRMYVPNGNGVCLKTNINKLYQSLIDSKDITYVKTHGYVGRVEYKKEYELRAWFKDKEWVKDHLLNIGCPKRAESLLFKRIEFKPENEIRLIYLEPNNKIEDEIYHYKVNPSDLIDEIIFDLRMDDSLYETFILITHKLGYSGKVQKSKLYQIPDFEISI